MDTFLNGVISSIAAAILIAISVKWIWPLIQNKCFYQGVRVNGTWDIIEMRNGEKRNAGRIELKQLGRRITGKGVRVKKRDGQDSHRQFKYKGTIYGHQVTLLFEDTKGVGFDPGSYVFIVQNDANTMIGNATFHGKHENKIVSEERTLIKVPS